jgi:PII-like signaling protein
MKKLPENGLLLRILIGEDDLYKGKPLYEQIVLKARELHIAGATVFRGIMGFGADSMIHSSKILQLSEDMPIIIEIIDIEENINKIIPFLEETVKGGLITIEKAKIIKHSSSKI